MCRKNNAVTQEGEAQIPPWWKYAHAAATLALPRKLVGRHFSEVLWCKYICYIAYMRILKIFL